MLASRWPFRSLLAERRARQGTALSPPDSPAYKDSRPRVRRVEGRQTIKWEDQNVRTWRLVFVRHGNRPWYSKHTCLCARQGDRSVRALCRRLSCEGWRQEGARGRRGCQADAWPHPRLDRGDPPDAGWGHRRFRRGRRDDQPFPNPRSSSASPMARLPSRNAPSGNPSFRRVRVGPA
jgi:hypothetical protein